MTKPARGWWPRIQRIWITTGISATIVFVTWSLLAYRASGPARDALVSDDRVEVTRGAHHWTFRSREGAPRIGLLFYPGALVNPVAYAPLLRAVAAAGDRVAAGADECSLDHRARAHRHIAPPRFQPRDQPFAGDPGLRHA